MVTTEIEPREDAVIVGTLCSFRGWTVSRLAREAQISRPYLYKCATGHRPLSDEARRKLAAIFPEFKTLLLVRVISEQAS